MPRQKQPKRPQVKDVGPFWPRDWPSVPMRSGPGVHQIRLFGHSGAAIIEVACVCGARLGSIYPAADPPDACWQLFRPHEKEATERGTQG